MVRLTARAAAKVRELVEREGDPAVRTLRVSVDGGGCSGFQYALGFDGEPEAGDVTASSHSVTVVVDRRSAAYVAGAGLDLVESTAGAGFRLDNPNVGESCGCGGSFQAEAAAPPEPAAGGCEPACGCVD